MRKSQSIYKLMELGLNTLDYFISSNKGEVLHYLARHAEDKLSMRTEKGDNWQCPFYFMVPGEQLVPLAIKHLGEGYTLLLSQSLSTEGCLAFGVVAFGETKDDLLEFVWGQGKVRDLDSHPDLKVFHIAPGMRAISKKDHPQAGMLNAIWLEMKEKAYEERPCCIEWSLYNTPVGNLKKNLICWEVRAYE